MSTREILKDSAAIRATYERLPFQGFWTWLTGKEIPGRPARAVSPLECTIWSIAQFLGGIALSVVLLACHAGWLGLVVSITLTVAGARYMVATVIHHGVHNAVFRSEAANRALCEILSTMTIVQPYDSYKRFHVIEHHGRDFSTIDDQDLAAIYKLGLTPGVPVSRMKWILFWQCINPSFHLRYFVGRLRSNLIGAPLYRLILTLVWIALLAVLASAVGGWIFLIAVVIPLTIVYQVCSLLHLVTEHAWVLRTGSERVRESHIRNSHARLCGRVLPAKNLSGRQWIFEWTSWWIEHAVVHLPVRLLIVQGSLIVHDWHHRCGADREWPNAIQKREIAAQKELEDDLCTYIDVWGIHHCLHYVLQRISDGPAPATMDGIKYRLN